MYYVPPNSAQHASEAINALSLNWEARGKFSISSRDAGILRQGPVVVELPTRHGAAERQLSSNTAFSFDSRKASVGVAVAPPAAAPQPQFVVPRGEARRSKDAQPLTPVVRSDVLDLSDGTRFVTPYVVVPESTPFLPAFNNPVPTKPIFDQPKSPLKSPTPDRGLISEPPPPVSSVDVPPRRMENSTFDPRRQHRSSPTGRRTSPKRASRVPPASNPIDRFVNKGHYSFMFADR